MTSTSDSLIATGLIDISNIDDDIKPVVWKGKQVDNDKLKHLSFQNLLGLDGEEDSVQPDPITGHLNLTLPRNSPQTKPKIRNIKDLFFEDTGKNKNQPFNATPKNTKTQQSLSESVKQTPTSSISSSLDEHQGRQRAHTVSETRTKSGTFSSDQQMKIEELRRKLMNDVTKAKTPSDSKKSQSSIAKKVTINVPDMESRTQSLPRDFQKPESISQDSGDPFSKYLQPQHNDEMDSPKISPFHDDSSISDPKSPLSEKDRRPATSLGIQRASKEKTPMVSSTPASSTASQQDENPKVLLRHASMSLIPNLKEGDEKQMKVEMILKNIKQQRQREEKVQQILQTVKEENK